MQNQCLSLLNMQICDVLPVSVIDKARYGRLKVSKRHWNCCQPTVILSYTYQPLLSFFKAEFTKIKTSAKKTTTTYLASKDYKASFFSFPGSQVNTWGLEEGIQTKQNQRKKKSKQNWNKRHKFIEQQLRSFFSPSQGSRVNAWGLMEGYYGHLS